MRQTEFAGQAGVQAPGPLPGVADRPRPPAPAGRRDLFGLTVANEPPALRQPEEMAAAHRQLLETIEHEVALYGTGEGERRLDPRVIAALGKVERALFVPADLEARAYDNRPLPIGHGQTISQPLIVAVMTHLLHLGANARVLEVGTGSGYQTAILAELAGEVVTVETVAEL